MNKEEFVSYVRAIIDMEYEIARVNLIKEEHSSTIRLVGSLSLIEKALLKLDNSTNISYINDDKKQDPRTELFPENLIY
jgi:hypothetical protein